MNMQINPRTHFIKLNKKEEERHGMYSSRINDGVDCSREARIGGNRKEK